MDSKVVLMALVALEGISSAALARNDLKWSQDGYETFTTSHDAARFVPNLGRKPKASIIYSNLATDYPKGLYWENSGATVGAAGAYVFFPATQFIPTADATAVEVRVAVGNNGDNKDRYTLSIYSDSAGLPGEPLASTDITATSAFGTCCALASAKFKGGVPLTGGTPYWVAITLNAKQMNAGDHGAWNYSTTDQVDSVQFAIDVNNAGWKLVQSTLAPAFAIYSK